MDDMMSEFVRDFVGALPSLKIDDQPGQSVAVDITSAASGLFSMEKADVLNSLAGISSALKTNDTVFPRNVYEKLVSLAIQDDDMEVVDAALDVLRLSISFKSAVPILLVELGIVDVILKRFPMKPVWGLTANLCLGGCECRSLVFDSGLLDRVPDAIRTRDTVTDASIAGMAQCLVYDVEEGFGIERYQEILIHIFLELLEMFKVTSFAHDSVVDAFRDLIDCHDVFLEWFINNGILANLMASVCKEPRFLERMCRLFCVLCELGRAKYVSEVGAIQWSERVKLCENVNAKISMYEFYEAFICEWGDDICSDVFWKESTVKDAKQMFHAPETTYKLRVAIANFLAAVFNHASPEGVFELWNHNIFKLLVDNFEMINFELLYTAITRLEIITRKTGTDPFEIVRDNEDLNEMIEAKYMTEDDDMAHLLQSIIWYDRNAEHL